VLIPKELRAKAYVRKPFVCHTCGTFLEVWQVKQLEKGGLGSVDSKEVKEKRMAD
jgi:hypothetical protein